MCRVPREFVFGGNFFEEFIVSTVSLFLYRRSYGCCEVLLRVRSPSQASKCRGSYNTRRPSFRKRGPVPVSEFCLRCLR